MKRNLRRVIAILMALFLCVGSVSWNELPAKAASAVYSGTDGALTWSIDSDGHLLVEGTGDYSGSTPAWTSHAMSIKTATIKVTGITKMSNFLKNCSELTSVDLSGLTTSSVTNMYGMFYGCSKLKYLDVSNFNTGKVVDMNGMFYGCASLVTLDLDNFNTQNVTNIAGMFYNCTRLKNLNVNNFNTKKVEYMAFLFTNCNNLKSLDLSSFDMASTTAVTIMFSGCDSLESIKTPKNNKCAVALPNGGNDNWIDTESKIYTELPNNLSYSVLLTYGTPATTSYSGMIGNLEWSINSKGHLLVEGTGDYTYNSSSAWWRYRSSIKTAEINVTDITNLSFLFADCTALTSVDLSGLNTSKVTNMRYMFNNCSKLTFVDLSGLDTSKVESMEMMFSACTSLLNLKLDGIDTTSVTDMRRTFADCTKLKNLDVSSFNTSNVTNMNSMFSNCKNLLGLDVSNFDTANVTDMSSMFSDCANVPNIDVSNFNTSNSTNMRSMFAGCSNLTSIDVTGFNTSNVTDMNSMFGGCSNLTNIDLRGFNTSNVKNMGTMFSRCSSLTNIDVSSFNTTNVTNMRYMFSECSGLTSLDVTQFDTTNATSKYGGLAEMFAGCSGLTSLDVSNFDTSNVVSMSGMFSRCSNLTSLDLSNFDMTNSRGGDMFIGCDNLMTLKTPKNNSSNIALYVNSKGYFTDEYGTIYHELPVNQGNSIMLTRVRGVESKQPDVGSGTAETPYEIDEAAELMWFMEKVNAGENSIHAKLTDDIDMNPGYKFAQDGNYTKSPEAGLITYWIPIGNDDIQYLGTFDGQNHVIKGIYCDSKHHNTTHFSRGYGLFGHCDESSEIKNLKTENSFIRGENCCGVGLICGISSGKISNCHGEGIVYGSEAGGICGASLGEIINCYSKGTISGPDGIGGICGTSQGSVFNCYNEGEIKSERGALLGGICGLSVTGVISNCYNTGTVYGEYGAGGICGQSSGEIVNCYNTGTVYGEYGAGGICGLAWSGEVSIENCYNIGSVTGNEKVDMIFGYTEEADVILSNNFYLANTETDSFDGTTYKTASQFASGEVAYLLQAAQTGTENVWGQLIGEETHPVLKGVKVYNVENCNGGQYSNSSESKAHNMINKVCVVCGEGKDVNLSGYTISLTGNIAVNFHVQLSEKVLSDSSAYMLFTFADGDTSKVKISDAELKTDGKKTYYVLTCEVQAPEINDEFTAKVITTVCETEVYTYSVKTYANYILNNTENNAEYAKAAPMIRAMLNYGGYSQKQFGHNTGSLANAGLYTESEDPVLVGTVPTLTEHAFTAPSKNIGVKYYGTSLLLNSETTIRHYFTFTEGENIAEIREKYEFKLADGTVLTPLMRGGMIYIDIKDINAADLDVKYEVTVTNKTTLETITFSYSALSYAKYVLDYALAGTNLVNVIKAMYFYNEAANSYFG